MDDIQNRLQDAAKKCLDAYVAWEKDKKDSKMQEGLSAAIHDLRKVSSRLEIELAVSERDQMTSQPLPIPPHKSTQKPKKQQVKISDGEGNGAPSGGNGPVVESKGPKRRRSGPRKAAGGEGSSE